MGAASASWEKRSHPTSLDPCRPSHTAIPSLAPIPIHTCSRSAFEGRMNVRIGRWFPTPRRHDLLFVSMRLSPTPPRKGTTPSVSVSVPVPFDLRMEGLRVQKEIDLPIEPEWTVRSNPRHPQIGFRRGAVSEHVLATKHVRPRQSTSPRRTRAIRERRRREGKLLDAHA
eukprot:scaffold85_cov358-Pavlova_lutheri.AAC.9